MHVSSPCLKLGIFITIAQNAFIFVSGKEVPQCALACIENASLGNCASTDNLCLCENSVFIDSVESCFQSTCEGSDLTFAEAFVSELGLRTKETGDETLASMRHVTEIREEVARLRQLLIGSQQLRGSSNPIPDQTAQLSEMREEMQRLRHLVSLQHADRQNIFDGVSRTTSPPAYED